MNNSEAAFISKNKILKSVSAKNCHSTESQSRDPSKQAPHIGRNGPLKMNSQINPSFVKNSSGSLYRAAPRISHQYDSFENSNSSKFGNSLTVQRLEEEKGRYQTLELKIEEYA